MLSRESSATLLDAVTAFLYKEARFQDEHQYEAWEALWTDDGVYWVPANGPDIDPEKEMSIIYDNRSRIALRVRQLLTGKHFTQTPQSRLRRLVSHYRNPATGYPSRPRIQFQRDTDGPYDHLARVKEWAAGEGGESE